MLGISLKWNKQFLFIFLWVFGRFLWLLLWNFVRKLSFFFLGIFPFRLILGWLIFFLLIFTLFLLITKFIALIFFHFLKSFFFNFLFLYMFRISVAGRLLLFIFSNLSAPFLLFFHRSTFFHRFLIFILSVNLIIIFFFHFLSDDTYLLSLYLFFMLFLFQSTKLFNPRFLKFLQFTLPLFNFHQLFLHFFNLPIQNLYLLFWLNTARTADISMDWWFLLWRSFSGVYDKTFAVSRTMHAAFHIFFHT